MVICSNVPWCPHKTVHESYLRVQLCNSVRKPSMHAWSPRLATPNRPQPSSGRVHPCPHALPASRSCLSAHTCMHGLQVLQPPMVATTVFGPCPSKLSRIARRLTHFFSSRAAAASEPAGGGAPRPQNQQLRACQSDETHTRAPAQQWAECEGERSPVLTTALGTCGAMVPWTATQLRSARDPAFPLPRG